MNWNWVCYTGNIYEHELAAVILELMNFLLAHFEQTSIVCGNPNAELTINIELYPWTGLREVCL